MFEHSRVTCVEAALDGTAEGAAELAAEGAAELAREASRLSPFSRMVGREWPDAAIRIEGSWEQKKKSAYEAAARAKTSSPYLFVHISTPRPGFERLLCPRHDGLDPSLEGFWIQYGFHTSTPRQQAKQDEGQNAEVGSET